MSGEKPNAPGIEFAKEIHVVHDYCPDVLSGYSHSSGTLSYDSIPEAVGRGDRILYHKAVHCTKQAMQPHFRMETKPLLLSKPVAVLPVNEDVFLWIEKKFATQLRESAASICVASRMSDVVKYTQDTMKQHLAQPRHKEVLQLKLYTTPKSDTQTLKIWKMSKENIDDDFATCSSVEECIERSVGTAPASAHVLHEYQKTVNAKIRGSDIPVWTVFVDK